MVIFFHCLVSFREGTPRAPYTYTVYLFSIDNPMSTGTVLSSISRRSQCCKRGLGWFVKHFLTFCGNIWEHISFFVICNAYFKVMKYIVILFFGVFAQYDNVNMSGFSSAAASGPCGGSCACWRCTVHQVILILCVADMLIFPMNVEQFVDDWLD